MIEKEAKFLVEDASEIAKGLESLRSDQLDLQEVAAVEVNDRYLDTPDWQIFRAGWAYRWRDAAERRSLALKSVAMSEDAVHVREELEQEIANFPSNGDSLPDGEVVRRLTPIDRTAVHELFQIHNRRRLFHIRTADGTLIELAIDRAEVEASVAAGNDGPRRMRFEELEMELKEGPEESFREAVEVVQQRFGLLPARLSKFERGLQTVGLSPPARLRAEAQLIEETDSFRTLRERRLRKHDPAVALAYQCLVEQFQQMLVQEPRAWEGLHPEGVHQMRVATRRARAALKAFRDVLPRGEVKKLNRELKWLAAVLGDVRDLDVYQDNLRLYAAEIGEDDAADLSDYQKHLSNAWRTSREALLACLTSPRYQQLKADFSRFLAKGSSKAGKKKGQTPSISDIAAKLVSRRYKRVLQDGRAITRKSPDKALHALRIDCKRLRYLFEFFESVYGEALRPFVQRLRRLQDKLGDFNDACVATERLRKYAESLPVNADSRRQLVVLGQLIHAQELQAAKRRSRFRKTWKRFDRSGKRKQIVRLLG